MHIDSSLAKKLAQSVRPLAVAALLVGALFQPDPARADHSIGRPCIDCHSLRSSNVVPGSRNVKQSEVIDPLYNADWYNPLGWTNNAANWPLDCSYCHSQDIGQEFALAQGGKRGTPTGVPTTPLGSAHPVDVRDDGVRYPSTLRITCNDCHNGPAGSPKITPQGLLAKSDTDGYPNHIDAVISPTSLPGENDLANNPPQLTAPYGPGAVWTKATPYAASDLLCFICHDGSDSTKPPFSTGLGEEANGLTSIMGEYSMTGGGHNVQGIGKGIGSGGVNELKRLPCFNCHDPHSGVEPDGTRANEALITATVPLTQFLNPYEPGAAAPFTFDGYKTTAGIKNDRSLCLNCHAATGPQADIEGNTPVRFMNPITVGNLAYGFHTNAHATVESAGNCLQANGGCHQSPHNTSPFDCLGCHNSNLPNYAKFPAALQAVAHVNSDFGMLDATGQIAPPNSNGIKSRHDIPYNKSANLTSPVNNGCLACHDVPGSVSGNLGRILAVAGTVFTGDLYGGANRISTLSNFSDRESLNTYDPFCLECHKGITSSDPSRQLGSYYPPQTNNQYDYFYNGGHGTGKGNETFTSGNSQAKIACIECHMYHGSTAHKLLPGDDQTTDSNGKVVKGFDYGAAPTLASKQSIGGVASSKKIDYTDYTMRTNGNDRLPDDKRRSFKYANYVGLSSSWNTYYDDITNTSPPSPPGATRISFGTAGDKIINGGTSVTSASDKEVGFCNTCHLYKNTTNGTNQTADWVSTHEGAKGAAGIPADFPSVRLFFKDCVECHDPHGSGDKNSDDANAYMVRGRIITDSNIPVDGTSPKVYNVVFKGKSGIDSGDEYYSAGTTVDTDKRDNLCAVCHTATSHNTREAVQNHNSGGDCFLCHPHGDKTKYVFPGFPGVPVGGCDGCHGYPPQRLDTASLQVPPEENYVGGGGPHVEHVNLIATANSLPLSSFPTPDQYKDNYSNNTRILCGPCHGELAPEHTSGNSDGAWDPTARTHVNMGQRTAATTSWGGSPKYNNQDLPVAPGTVMAEPSGVAMGMGNSVCTNVDCHAAPTVPAELAWYATTDENEDEADTASTFNPQDAPKRTRICFDCHDITPPDIRIFDYAGTQVYGKLRPSALANMYDPKKINVAANYFGTLSEFGRGGHGDPNLVDRGLDVNSASVTPQNGILLDCTACHNWTATHFSMGATEKTFRLRNPVLETSGHGSTGLCNQTGCHSGTLYPGTVEDKHLYKHHPSYRPTPSAPTKAINRSVTDAPTWSRTGLTWSQSGYAPSVAALFGSSQLKDVDYFTDWYNRGDFWTPTNSANHNQATEPMGALINVSGALTSYAAIPMATLPLAKDITGASGAEAQYFMCVTCHNPHGTDLYVHLGSGGTVNQAAKDSADNNMLRLKADDNRLCIACH